MYDRAQSVCQAGKSRPTQTKGIRNPSTEKLESPFDLQIVVTSSNKIITVKMIADEHRNE